MKKGNVVLGLLAGLAAGAVLGILFAPEKGSRTRRKIMHKGEDLADELKDKFDGLFDDINEKYETVKSKTEAFIGGEKAKFEEAKSKAKDSIA